MYWSSETVCRSPSDLVDAKRTRAITEAIGANLVVITLLLILGVAWGGATAIHFTFATFATAGLVHTFWLAWRTRQALGSSLRTR